MSKPDYKTLLTPQFVKDLRSIYDSVSESRQEIRENLNDEMWCNDVDLSAVEYFIYDLEEVADYLEANK
jgi:hypothetical protein